MTIEREIVNALAPVVAGVAPIVYDVTDEAIAEIREQYAALSCETPAGYEETRIAIGKLRSSRTAVEARRKELKDPALEYGRLVDSRAKHLTAKLQEIEDPLQAMKDAADVRRAEEKRQREEAALVAREAELKAEREAEEARLKAEREAEEQRLAAERAAFEERKRIADEERARVDAAQAAERSRLDAERAELDAQKEAIAAAARAAEEAEARRVALIQADKDLAAKKERERIEAETRAAAAVAEEARLDAMKPDIERLRAWSEQIQAFAATAPDLDSPDVAGAVAWSRGQIVKTAKTLLQFNPKARA